MEVAIAPGTYVVAVSGGVDSMVLLDVMAHLEGLKLVVAHFDHGIRLDSEEDRALVRAAAEHYGLPFVFDEGHLGPKASEAAARSSRYRFLRAVRRATSADAILTAHHEDDVIETAIINMMRGTNRRGLASLHAYSDVVRPLLGYTKPNILAYAKEHRIKWREDTTNQDTRYLRNYVRHNILAKLSDDERTELLKHINNMAKLNTDIERDLINHLHMHPTSGQLDRHWFIMLPHNVAREVLASWLRSFGVINFDSKLLEKLIIGAKTLQPGKRMDVDKEHRIVINKGNLALSA
ncbi:MAG TPA: tRNA lysidine(34) synthetase TilS [Candidatus Saccharimonadales bacterium]|nr:tRNA lysidine(34) synthetase TilS [Candidatus Saccharimonadales bacterium]